MPRRGTKTKNAKLKIAAHHNAKGRGGAKKSAKVRKREAELDILADEREAEIKLEAAAKRQERWWKQQELLEHRKTKQQRQQEPQTLTRREGTLTSAQTNARAKKRRRVTVHEVAMCRM